MTTLLDLLARRLVLSYLHRKQQALLNHQPQMCCYAFDAISMHIAVDGMYEREELQLVMNQLAPYFAGRTVLDVGANIGNHSVEFAKVAKRVLALEPHPISFKLLELNVHRLGNVTTLNVGASDKTAVLEAGVPTGNVGATRIGRHWTGEAIQLPVQRVDDLPDLHDVGLIKVDVEGHEEPALRGMERLLRRDQPLVIIEQNEDAIVAGSTPAIEFLHKLGYGFLYEIQRRHPWRTNFGRVGHAIEALLRGIPPLEGVLVRLESLDQRDYACLVASASPLNMASCG